MKNRRILIITYYWPPSGGVGVQRWLHFAKNLKEMGWEPIIYTPENPQFDIHDESLLAQSKGISVIKRKIWEPFDFLHRLTGNKNRNNIQQGSALEKSGKSWKDQVIIWIRGNLFIPDPRVFWVRPSIKFLKREIAEREIETIVTTGPPHSMHLIGLGIKKKLPRIKWLADFRDPWSDWDLLDKLKTGKLARYGHGRLENKVFRSADTILVTSTGTAKLMSQNHNIAAEVITNGISETYEYLNQRISEEGKLVIGYFGMLNDVRNPDTFWQALEELCVEDPVFLNRLEIRIGGIISESVSDGLKSRKFAQKIKFMGYLPHGNLFKEYRKCDMLLLLQNKSENSKFLIPAKFFEYLVAGRPILGLGEVPSDLGDLFSSRQIGVFMAHTQFKAMKEFITAIYNRSFEINLEDYKSLIGMYSRNSQAMKLALLLEKQSGA
ncbi:glycosyl transferase [Marinoscillum sp.]|uniref:glycosyl transferase n=1 Tax=Marinoscillum sp. TaxID=2024838 RepID=UPI003BA9040E